MGLEREWRLEAYNPFLLRMKIWGSQEEMMPSSGYTVSWNEDLCFETWPFNQVRDVLHQST